MEQFIDALLMLVPCMLVAWSGPWVVRYCKKLQMVADITERHAHTNPTPHGGGIGFVSVGVLFGLGLIWGGPYIGIVLPFKDFLTVLMVCSAMVAWVGWLDDTHELGARERLAVHLAMVTVALAFMPPLFDFVPLWVEKVVLLLAWGWFVNLYNFMDGADGLAASEAVFLGLAIALLVPALKPLAIMVAAVAMGFLRVNWQPAKVFMGDVGSTWLGYVLGGILLVSLTDDTWRMVWPLATITLVFCGDATYTLASRVLRGYKPWEPHREFWFHRALRYGYSHAQVVWRVLAINMALLAVAIWGYLGNYGWLTLAAGLLVFAAAAWYVKRLETGFTRKG